MASLDAPLSSEAEVVDVVPSLLPTFAPVVVVVVAAAAPADVAAGDEEKADEQAVHQSPKEMGAA